MDDKLLYFFIGTGVTALGWIIKEVIVRTLNKNKEEREFKLKLLEEIYSIVGELSTMNLLQTEKDPTTSAKSGKLGFNLQVFFPNLFNDDYENFLNLSLLLKNDIIIAHANGTILTTFATTYLIRHKEVSDAAVIMYKQIVKESMKHT